MESADEGVRRGERIWELSERGRKTGRDYVPLDFFEQGIEGKKLMVGHGILLEDINNDFLMRSPNRIRFQKNHSGF